MAYTCRVTNLNNTQQANAFNKVYADAGYGETYDAYASKSDSNNWYCAKIPWWGYKNASGVGVDIDHDLGYWVWPVDILNDWDVYVLTFFE